MTPWRFRIATLAVLLLLPIRASADYWVLGGVCSTCNSGSTVNQLFDDGLHHDGGAGDGVYGADIVADVPAGLSLWSISSLPYFSPFPGLPYCWCNADKTGRPAIWTSVSGELVHYTVDTRSNGWYPSPGVASDHYLPAPSPMNVNVGSVIGYPQPLIVAPATHSAPMWEAIGVVHVPGTYYYWFSSQSGVLFTGSYNTDCGCQDGEQPVATVTTARPDAYVRFQFDESVGRMRADIFDPTASKRSTWGQIKTIYR